MMPLGKSQPEPIRFYAEEDARLPSRLISILADRIAALSETVLNGQLSELDYRFSTGQISGLREALSECVRLGKELNGD
jgi:hypothetical protein